jgi:hypothetical protein
MSLGRGLASRPATLEPNDPMTETQETSIDTAEDRRTALKKLGRFVAVTPPAIILLLSVTAKPAKAKVLSPIIL